MKFIFAFGLQLAGTALLMILAMGNGANHLLVMLSVLLLTLGPLALGSYYLDWIEEILFQALIHEVKIQKKKSRG